MSKETELITHTYARTSSMRGTICEWIYAYKFLCVNFHIGMLSMCVSTRGYVTKMKGIISMWGTCSNTRYHISSSTRRGLIISSFWKPASNKRAIRGNHCSLKSRGIGRERKECGKMKSQTESKDNACGFWRAKSVLESEPFRVRDARHREYICAFRKTRLPKRV